jgi:hypothetical protein
LIFAVFFGGHLATFLLARETGEGSALGGLEEERGQLRAATEEGKEETTTNRSVFFRRRSLVRLLLGELAVVFGETGTYERDSEGISNEREGESTREMYSWRCSSPASSGTKCARDGT